MISLFHLCETLSLLSCSYKNEMNPDSVTKYQGFGGASHTVFKMPCLVATTQDNTDTDHFNRVLPCCPLKIHHYCSVHAHVHGGPMANSQEAALSLHPGEVWPLISAVGALLGSWPVSFSAILLSPLPISPREVGVVDACHHVQLFKCIDV